MQEQYTTYWPTYEGLRVLQEADEAQLAGLIAQPRSGKDIDRLVQITRLRIAIRLRRGKMNDFEQLARDILTGCAAPVNSFTQSGTGYVQPF